MASALTDKLSQLVKQISGQARITESNVTDTQCFPIHLPLDGFVSGAATFTVAYKSSTSTGVSSVGQLVIP